MSFSQAWQKIQDSEPMDRLDTLDKTRIQRDSVHNVHIVHKTKNEKQAPPAPAGDDWFDDMISMAIGELNDAGCQYMDASQEDRDRARMLEIEYTVAANDGDSARFWKALREWKAIWIKELH
jgi:hypothetical protein